MALRFLLILVGIILCLQAYLLTVDPSNRQAFVNSIKQFNKWESITHMKICCHGVEDARMTLIALMCAAAYSCILADQLIFAMIAQLLWMVSQINTIDMTTDNIKFIGIQILILFIIVTAMAHHRRNYDGKSKNQLDIQKSVLSGSSSKYNESTKSQKIQSSSKSGKGKK